MSEPKSWTLAAFQGGGEMAKVIRAQDWSRTPLGPIESWPQSLRTTVSLCLASNFPISLAWGPEHTQIYNDGYWPICGAKHPHSMGQNFRECWASPWPAIGDAFERALGGETSYLENQRMFLDRNGYLEETFFTFSFSPIRDETGGVGGLFHPVTETTARMLSERRTRALRDMTARAGKAHSVEDAGTLAAAALGDYALDLPFVLLYLLDERGTTARLSGASGLARGSAASPKEIDLARLEDDEGWPLRRVLQTGLAEQVDDLCARFGALASGPYPEPPHTALILPIGPPGAVRPLGILIAGVSPRRALDEAYRVFYELLAGALTAVLNNARVYQDERRRAEALAELDRAKTAFFSNVSHEFRTPLTLILGPVEDALSSESGALTGAKLDLVRRNALRLFKMVNTLLDFSRMEAGRAQATFVPTDLSSFTCELASAFQSAAESSGVRLIVDCPALPEPIYVDPEMWEKVVLNLLSNAVKYTYAGQIKVSLACEGAQAVLRVSDTGVGIPEDELPRVFERFYRVRSTRGRSHEGTGIGLSLVQELTKLHGGGVSAVSQLGAGTTFTVRVPRGCAHLPPERVERTSRPRSSAGAAPFVEEARRWAHTEARGETQRPAPLPEVGSGMPAARILVADDNADLRSYVTGLLAPIFGAIQTASDGEAALDIARRDPPDLILSDVMMPRLDGFGLVRALRADERTRAIPIILLSARAGEESATEGLSVGADDYLVKPFSSRELLARVGTQLRMARIRREVIRHELVEGELRQAVQMRDEFLSVASHELRTPLTSLGLQADGLLRALAEMPRSDALAPRLLRKAEAIRRQATRLEQLIDGLLDVSSIAGGRLRLEPHELDLATLARDVVERLEEHGKRPGMPIELSLKSCVGRWDPRRLEQILTTLITNAFKFGEGRPIEVQVEDGVGRARLVVKDRGIGIARQDQERIFGRFERAVSEGHYGGLGLGLWIARQLVEAMGGLISVVSTEGEGSTFVVELPKSA